jgi:hypothetical protein
MVKLAERQLHAANRQVIPSEPRTLLALLQRTESVRLIRGLSAVELSGFLHNDGSVIWESWQPIKRRTLQIYNTTFSKNVNWWFYAEFHSVSYIITGAFNRLDEVRFIHKLLREKINLLPEWCNI